MRRYLQGQGIRVSTPAAVTDGDGQPVDPSTIVLILQKPDGTTQEYSTPAHDGTGLYHQDLSGADISPLGTYEYQWVATGTGEGVSEPVAFTIVASFLIGAPFAVPEDVADIWPGYTAADEQRVASMLEKASAKLRQACPFNIDERISRFAADPSDPLGIDPIIAADVVANIAKRVLVNPNGILSGSQTAGPYSQSQVFASRTSDTGDSGSSMRVTPGDIDQLRPAVKTVLPSTIRLRPPHHIGMHGRWRQHWITQ